jgi:rhamnulokinase
LTEASTYAAIDLGAESGRVVVGRLTDGRVDLDVVHRFANRPVHLPDGLHWNLLALFSESLRGLALASQHPALAGVGIDAWGVDYALLDVHNRVLGLPFHYRDSRTDGMISRAHARVARADLYAVTGIQTMPINTLFQLMADEGSAALAGTERLAFVPDLFALWLTGVLANESTVASTSGLLDARSGTWAREVIAQLGLPAVPFAGDPIEAGTTLAAVLPEDAGEAAGVPVHLVAGHDTASAFAAAPVRSAGAAILSSGTWSLLGVEIDEPVLDARAAAFNLTNERGVDGTIRLLRNVMGLWLVQECRRHWEAAGGPCEYEELHRLADRSRPDAALFDPDDDEFFAPGDMPARIAAACKRLGQPAPATPGEIVRSIVLSLACKYRLVLERLEQVTGRELDCIHVIGGGARNRLLGQLTADVTRRPVYAGPVEATAMGNVLMQARATGRLGSLAEMREIAAASAAPETFEPRDDQVAGSSDYERFLAVTGLTVDTPEHAITS